MALWAGATLNTNALSSAINKWFDKNATPMVVKNNALLYAMLGREGADTTPRISSKFRKEKRISGNAINVRLLGELETFTGLADANQTDAASVTWNTDAYGAATFAWGHFYYREPIVESELELIRGDEAKTANWLEDVLTKVRKSWEKTLGDGLNSADAPARTTIGGWRYSVDDSATYDAYGGITRSDSGNADFRSYVTASVGDLSLDHVDTAQLQAIQRGGNPDVGVCGLTPYKKLMQELRGYTTYNDQTWDKFKGGLKVGYNNVVYVFDHRGSDTDLGLLDSSAFTLYLDEDGVSTEGFQDSAWYYKGTRYVLPINNWVQSINRCPSWSAKLSGITG